MNDSLLSRIDNHIIIDLIESWPEEIIQIIDKNQNILRRYLQLEKEIDTQAEEDAIKGVYRPENKYEFKWLYIMNQLDAILKQYRFVGFHCTKLIDLEIHNICAYGLEPLNSEKLDSRIDLLCKNKLINDNIAEELKKNNLSSASNRKGRLFFFHGSKTLKDEWGLYRLFRTWGGEALYAKHEKNIKIFKELFSIGKPCIVLGSLSYEEINQYNPLASRFISVFLNKDDFEFSNHDFESIVNKNVKVLSVITTEEETFDQLTNFSTWKLDI